MRAIRFSVVIPCFNEARALPVLLEEAIRIAESEHGEFILVDNGSSDETLKILNSVSNPRIRWVSSPNNLGYGGGILLGLQSCLSEHIGWTHADLQTPLEDVVACVKSLERGVSFVKGRRRGRKPSDWFFSASMSLFESTLFGVKLWDINAQPTIFKREIMDFWATPPSDFSLDLYALVIASKLDFKIERVDVSFLSRRFGTSNWNTGPRDRFRFISRTLKYSLKLRSELKIVNHSA